MDVDKDGFVSAADIEACFKNLPNSAFWRDGGAALTQPTFNTKTKFYPTARQMPAEKAAQVIQQINEGLGQKKLTYRQCFEACDASGSNMVSCGDFVRGVSSLVPLAAPVLEQLYCLMDKSGVGLITYQQFLDVLRAHKIEQPKVSDNFDWEASTIARIREWMLAKKCTVEEAFRLFDADVDGFVSRADLETSLVRHLDIAPK